MAVVDGWGNTYPSNRIYGNYVIVKHGGGVYSLYGHLAKGVYVVKGQVVKQGQVLGYMGNTGYSMGQHLHFEYRAGGNSKAYAQDPLKYLECPATVKISDSSLYRSQISGMVAVAAPRHAAHNKAGAVQQILQLRLCD